MSEDTRPVADPGDQALAAIAFLTIKVLRIEERLEARIAELEDELARRPAA